MALGFTNTGSVGGFMDGEVVLFSDLGIEAAPYSNISRIGNISRCGYINNNFIFTQVHAYPSLYNVDENGKITSISHNATDLNLRANMIFYNNEILQVTLESEQIYISTFNKKGIFKDKVSISGVPPKNNAYIFDVRINKHKEFIILMRRPEGHGDDPYDFILIIDGDKKYIKAQSALPTYSMISDSEDPYTHVETDNTYIYIIDTSMKKIYVYNNLAQHINTIETLYDYKELKFIRNSFLRDEVLLIDQKTKKLCTVTKNNIVYKYYADGFAQLKNGYLRSYDNTLYYYNSDFKQIWSTIVRDKINTIGGLITTTGDLIVINGSSVNLEDNIYKLKLMAKVPIKKDLSWWER
ncbi:hypothetical protein DP125_13125 [Clostridium tetani]|uniref:Uncharacterized protein n=1 Tax=Clostridium tetani TaxID=1513 RepID=A0ABY0ETW1_CLOTA|nr:hypothetical protein [Clostridium tetani]KHO37862.1 hypothetical protein OR62_10905 [Clostridium tetani]RXI56921.1 hypothetical protein DP131_06380 [Clostridium tetani]RXI57630.1 hypothetical protein DP125_13125 [Clostridium tetani]RXI74594.1 hypothetical protein DQN76_00200 [Clostridium tetani]